MTHTHIELESEDRRAISIINRHIGNRTIVGAIRWALREMARRIVAERENDANKDRMD